MIRETPNFILTFEERDPRCGPGIGVAGVRSMSIIDWYCEGLEASARVFSGNLGWEWPSTVKTPVYVADLVQQFALVGENIPFTSAYKGVPFIGLPCRINEPTVQGAREKAMADAAHEAVHVLNAKYRPFMNANSAPWRWFNEGTAVFGERYVLPGNADNLRFAMDWCDRPEESLDSDEACYQSGFFVDYLVGRFGASFLARVWNEGELTETPVETMDRLLQTAGIRFAHASPDVSDVFGDGYAVDAYCAWGGPANGFARDAFQRYSSRATRESFELKAGDSVGLHNGCEVLDHLATRYFRFYLDQNVRSLQVSLESSPADGMNRFKATLVTVTDDLTRGPSVRLTPAEMAADGRASMVYQGALSVENAKAIDHVVLVVANCGVRCQSGSGISPHDDDQSFAVQAKAI